jgi:hypothetical protein
MKRNIVCCVTCVLTLTAFVSAAHAQSDIYWNIDPGVKDCSMVIDAELTQDQFTRYTRQVGLIMAFKSLSSAETLGKMNFSFGLEMTVTPIDQHDLAWINTFTHPGPECPLGDAVSYPQLRARMGVSDNMDVGAYYTTSPEANYGFLGMELKYLYRQASGKSPAVALRATYVTLLDVPDYNMNTLSLDIAASRQMGIFKPYVGLRGSVVEASETTPKVDLDRVVAFLPQGVIGVAFSKSWFNIAAEIDIGEISGFTMVLGAGF